MPIRYGLCCLWDNKRTCHLRRPTLARLKRESPDQNHWQSTAALYAYNNLPVVLDLIQRCTEARWNLRLSSHVTPLLTHPDVNGSLRGSTLYRAMEIFVESVVIPDGMRLSMHPSAYCRLASLNPATVKTSAAEINLAAELLDLFPGGGHQYARPINVHVGTAEPDLANVMNRFMRNAELYLTESALRKLVLENDDRGPWTVTNLKKYGWSGPITLDFLHQRLNLGERSPQDELEIALTSWRKFGVQPQFHWSESAPGPNPRAHALMPQQALPLAIWNLDIDLDVELKGKSDAIKRLEQLDAERAQSLSSLSCILAAREQQQAPQSV